MYLCCSLIMLVATDWCLTIYVWSPLLRHNGLHWAGRVWPPTPTPVTPSLRSQCTERPGEPSSSSPHPPPGQTRAGNKSNYTEGGGLLCRERCEWKTKADCSIRLTSNWQLQQSDPKYGTTHLFAYFLLHNFTFRQSQEREGFIVCLTK